MRILVEDFLLANVFKSRTGETMVREMRPKDDEGTMEVWTNLSDMVRAWTPKTATLGSDSDAQQLDVFLLRWAREGFTLFWSCHSLYDALGLTSYNHQRSKWAYESFPAWESKISCLPGASQFLRSSINKAHDKINFSTEEFLPAPAASTFALLSLYALWAGAPPTKGGLRNRDASAKAKDHLKHFVGKAFTLKYDHVIDVEGTNEWTALDGRPKPWQNPYFQITIRCDGNADFSDLHAMVEADQPIENDVLVQWWYQLKPFLSDTF